MGWRVETQMNIMWRVRANERLQRQAGRPAWRVRALVVPTAVRVYLCTAALCILSSLPVPSPAPYVWHESV
jgi:hypothetical protein